MLIIHVSMALCSHPPAKPWHYHHVDCLYRSTSPQWKHGIGNVGLMHWCCTHLNMPPTCPGAANPNPISHTTQLHRRSWSLFLLLQTIRLVHCGHKKASNLYPRPIHHHLLPTPTPPNSPNSCNIAEKWPQRACKGG